ncbi:MAG TPA: transglycosylase family protein [Acidimicrobiales bacterium]|nr:transglycosylase family protein [Acidimicrobiales bacterium]
MTARAAAGRSVRPAGPQRRAARRRARGAHIRVAGPVFSAALVVVGTSAAWGGVAPPAAAANGGSLQAKAAAISATIAADGAALQHLGEHYLAERHAYAIASARAAVLRRAIARASAAVARDRRRVLEAAVSAYVNAGSDSGLVLLLDANAGTLAAGQAYLRVASDQLRLAISELRDNEHSLSVSLTTERRAAASARSALARTASDRASVLRTVASEQHLLASVRGELAVLVHEQELARERAQAEAERAAARAAAARAAAAATATAHGNTSNTTSGPGAPGALPTVAGPPAPNGVPPSTSPIPSGTIAQDFAGIRNCESSDDYSLDTGNGYYGAYQFSLGTWEGLGGTGLPSSAPPPIQDALAYKLYLASGWGPWPECAAILGL